MKLLRENIALVTDKQPDVRPNQMGMTVLKLEIHGLTEDEAAAFEAFIVGVIHVDEYFAKVMAVLPQAKGYTA